MKYKQDRFYLDFLNAGVFANISGKKLAFSADNMESNIRVCEIKDFVEHFFSDKSMQLPPPSMLDRLRKDVWAMISPNALFDPKRSKEPLGSRIFFQKQNK